MPLFEYPELAFTQIAFLVLSVIWFLKRNDEIPLIISSFLFYVASYRYWAVEHGINQWIKLSWFISKPITQEAALEALMYITLGEICLLSTYMLCQRRSLAVAIPPSDRSVLQWLRPKTLLLGLFCLPLVILTRSQIATQLSAGSSLAFQINNYLYLFPFALVGIAILVVCLWRFGAITSLINKVMALSILTSVFYLTFGSQARFQFLGWMIAAGIIVSSFYRPKIRLALLTLSLILAMAVFAISGAMRNPNIANQSLNQIALERALGAEDANMLDGFVLLKNVYPEQLDFRWGMEHLEIFIRPIPRAWWPEKPVGGYMNKLGFTIAGGRGTVGISPTIFGSFYAEIGLFGILFFAPLYGLVIAKVVRYSTQLQPFAGVLVRAILCSSLIPLLRGGDLAGIYAWIGMAFWPCFLLLWMKRRNLTLRMYPSTHPYPSNPHPPMRLPHS
ncbi:MULTISPECIES: hypothetical protein [Trichocoleus]|uniref:Oligosaccharide repeat unit polymerase n=1 Tax=Trichocoleus desertorum GB2-A4 TaxID=2933944 RepID=A0ABV0J787_9CYAN|nr:MULTISPECIES: hypothetical protein [unclassified Trichocoleus]MBD1862614.1 hypothetical protein [Trichocoleus sp. FACHB-46]MBD2121684.1 hypothetical protein [Trichocoleus sp. FACHB-262]